VHANGQPNGEKMKENKYLVLYWNMNKNGGKKWIQINGIRMIELGWHDTDWDYGN
jgi:hypothetical protein